MGAKSKCAPQVAFVLAALAASAGPAGAHNIWADGKPVPDWVKQSCCGPADAHHLRPDQVQKVPGEEAARLRPKYANIVRASADYYVVDGYDRPIWAEGRNVLPSEDGDYWLFYNNGGRACGYEPQIAGGQSCYSQPQSDVYCFFAPMVF